MPYAVEKRGRKYAVVKKADGKVLGSHNTRGDALRQIIAIKINEGS